MDSSYLKLFSCNYNNFAENGLIFSTLLKIKDSFLERGYLTVCLQCRCYKNKGYLGAVEINNSSAHISCNLAQTPTPSTLFLTWCSQCLIRDNEFISWLGANSDFHALNWYESAPLGLGICLNYILVPEQNYCWHSTSPLFTCPNDFHSYLNINLSIREQALFPCFVRDAGCHPGTIFHVITEPCNVLAGDYRPLPLWPCSLPGEGRTLVLTDSPDCF